MLFCRLSNADLFCALSLLLLLLEPDRADDDDDDDDAELRELEDDEDEDEEPFCLGSHTVRYTHKAHTTYVVCENECSNEYRHSRPTLEIVGNQTRRQ